MPNRVLHERVCTSDTLAALSAEAERLFYRLMVKADDWGRFDARPTVVRAACFPLQLDQINDDDVAAWLDTLADAGLLDLYEVSGRPYLVFCTWDRYQRRRATESKFPAPLSTADNRVRLTAGRCQPPADAGDRARMSATRGRSPADDGLARAGAVAAGAGNEVVNEVECEVVNAGAAGSENEESLSPVTGVVPPSAPPDDPSRLETLRRRLAGAGFVEPDGFAAVVAPLLAEIEDVDGVTLSMLDYHARKYGAGVAPPVRFVLDWLKREVNPHGGRRGTTNGEPAPSRRGVRGAHPGSADDTWRARSAALGIRSYNGN